MDKAVMLEALKERKSKTKSGGTSSSGAQNKEETRSGAPIKEKRKVSPEKKERCRKRHHEGRGTGSTQESIPEDPITNTASTTSKDPEPQSIEEPYTLLDASNISFVSKPSEKRDFGGLNKGIWSKSSLGLHEVVSLARWTVPEGATPVSGENMQAHPGPCELDEEKFDWAIKMRIRSPEFETSICDVKYRVSLSPHFDSFTDSLRVIRCRDWVRSRSMWDSMPCCRGFTARPNVCMAIESLTTLDLPMVVNSIGIYELKGPYYRLTMIDWFLQTLSVIPRGSWDEFLGALPWSDGMKGERKTHNKKLFSKFSPSPPLPPPVATAVVALRCDRPGEEVLLEKYSLGF
ncbi:hypothetical protein F511_38821 [Dorcoceras hygrometricum]|uniref:Uncharacterized protein n=1 Tax=Dorcoceras hygrometricum TaxID=472368 RepID=A0A2Z7BBK3_9LAMI|nr:hypothetical protein F511_38821 [Dorcoceras hygrometricum]